MSDAVLVVSFGGPEGPDDVMPFLEHVVRGKRVPRERLEVVAEHYHHFGGKSPINDQTRALADALAEELSRGGREIEVHVGNVHAPPFLKDTLERMKKDGVERAVAVLTSAFGGHAACRKYLDAVEEARREIGEGAPVVERTRLYYDHPGFIGAMAERVRAAIEELPELERATARIAFTAHSVPDDMPGVDRYVEQLDTTSRLVAEALGRSDWQLVYQSRSGPPSQPWLGPDVLEHLQALGAIGVDAVVVAPIGFVSDHMEVVWDLDVEAKRVAGEVGLAMARAATVGTHPRFVAALAELVRQRLEPAEDGAAIAATCAPDCCRGTK